MASLVAQNHWGGVWRTRHNLAVARALNCSPALLPYATHDNSYATALVQMARAWQTYAKAYTDRNSDETEKGLIAEDHYLGPYWLEIGQALRRLLSGEIEGLDGGTMDSFLYGTITENGFNEGVDF